MKILIVANNQKWKSWDKKIQEIKDWFNPIKLDIDIIHTSIKNIPYEDYGIHDGAMRKGVSKSWFYREFTAKYTQYGIIIFSVSRTDWDCFPIDGWQWNGNSIAVGASERGSYNFKGVKYPGGKWFNVVRHEICHALYVKQGKLDRTHYHWETGDLSRVVTELTTVPQEPSIPAVTLTRNQDDGYQTLGEIEVNGLKFNTLELSYKGNQRNISAIPKGTYDVKQTFSPKFMKYTYEVIGVPNRSAIRIHTGNYFTDIQGCILIGNGYRDLNKDNRLDIINSTASIKSFEQALNNKPFKLIIK